ncbi:uncharacterized protein LOC134666579 [Cydia fagiglandana]|uniref:uncharacterized protein LOC134666579 n=1 Tax=Cydia fagiglandana TaxID=1458189 RepID=UPI002FEE42D8
MPGTSEGELKLLCDIQRLNHNEWFNLRYAEIQKVYNHTPGYTDLETNDEVREYDQNPHLVQADRAFGALTYCMLKQQEALHAAVQDVLTWAQGGTEIVHEALREKLNSVFLSGDYYKVSEDFLQVICGHRAEVIQMRRNGITKHVKDKLVKSALRKIPPSGTSLFNAEAFTAAIEKYGGVRKCFWPLPKTPASQAGPSKMTSAPSQGAAPRKVLSQGTRYNQAHAAGNNYENHGYSDANNIPPSRGGYHHPYPSQGYQNTYNSARSNTRPIPGPSFRDRQPRDYQQRGRGGRKRPHSPAGQRQNKRRRY